MFGVSMWELILILVVALIALGPRQMAETAKVLGKLYRDLQRMLTDVRSTIDFDSLTNPTNSSSNSNPSPPPPPTPPPANLFPEPGKKSGPDFYAELLEKSREDAVELSDEDEKKPEQFEEMQKSEPALDNTKEPTESGDKKLT